MIKVKHLMYCPLTGLGLYNGYRGERWLKNRVQILKQFVIPSLKAQTSHNFTLWISVRPKERSNKYIKELKDYLDSIKEFKSIITYSGLCFYDDKYEDKVAKRRLMMALHGTTQKLINEFADAEYILMTIQPSDDLYINHFIFGVQKAFEDNPNIQAIGFEKGYICNYLTKELANYNPSTNPPFYTIKFKKEDFIEPIKHIEYISLKKDVGKYKTGCPLPSHEYVENCLKYMIIKERGFIVGTHIENISTYFNHPFKGEMVDKEVLNKFGIAETLPLKIKVSLRKKILRKLSFKFQKKLRYWFGELIYNKIYEFLRG